MEEDKQSSKSFMRPLIISLGMFIVILVVPSYIHIWSFLEISSITWIFRMREGEPFQLFLAFDQIIFFNSLLRCLFVLMIYRFYSNETTLKRTLVVGTLIEIFYFVSINGSTLLYTILPVSGFHPGPLSDFPLPIALLIFLILAKLVQPSKPDQDPSIDDWLDIDDHNP